MGKEMSFGTERELLDYMGTPYKMIKCRKCGKMFPRMFGRLKLQVKCDACLLKEAGF